MPDTNTVAQYAGGLAAGLLAIAVVLQKFLIGWRSNNAEGSVISLLHQEIERMSQQNQTLSEELGKLQVEVISLNAELRKLNTENQRLHSEVGALTAEVVRLQTILQEKTNGSQNKF
jgi:predicted nuclease with TOPRIM domain